MIRFAFYGRVSTEDQQDPASSKQWQLHRSRALIEPAGGVVVAEFFDIGQSRSLPWKRRPEAARLLASLAQPDRGFDAIVIGEPQRAFYGNQFGLTFPVLTHYGVALWVPEVGGAVDPGSEAHDLVMMLFGGMSKGERTRIKTRVRTAMSAQAEMQGRFLGGRPPYGYRLVDAGPHTNPEKASDGKRLHRLEPDPVTAPIVRRIYDDYLAGIGYLALAEQLTAEGIASPSGYDRERNPHRHGRAWGKSAVRAILMNPRYTGYQVWAKQRREEVLVDVEDVGAGHRTVMRWNGEAEWVWSAEMAQEPLIDRELYEAVQAKMQAAKRGPQQRRPKATQRPYLLRGRLHCGLCGRRLQGSWHHNEPYYRCLYAQQYAAASEFPHPKAVYLRESDLLPDIDSWLGTIFDPENVDATCEAMVGAVDTTASAIARTEAQAAIKECDRKLEHYRAALDAGTDPRVVGQWIAEVTSEKRHAETALRAASADAEAVRMTKAQVREAVEEIGGLVGLLGVSRPKLRTRFYEEIGLTAVYDPHQKVVEATADLGVRISSVRGGT
ncbi:MAG: Recombinase [Acidimicrobiales bacterium]|nr:Recombinase [Acidimicrobiales bacterium]